jgi:hypothetical protein
LRSKKKKEEEEEEEEPINKKIKNLFTSMFFN